MKGIIASGFFMLITFSFIVFVPDLIVYGTLTYKANAVVEKTTKEAEMQGGVTTSVEEEFQKIMSKYGMQDKDFKVAYDRKGTIEHRGHFEVRLQGEHTFRAFNLLGTGVGTFTLPITAVDSGVSEVWYR